MANRPAFPRKGVGRNTKFPLRPKAAALRQSRASGPGSGHVDPFIFNLRSIKINFENKDISEVFRVAGPVGRGMRVSVDDCLRPSVRLRRTTARGTS
ncbi:hypothetical protein SL003B_3213 [Polymorphum gilvum SL003B-26A1]|uniref:Uncharacterized protein n=1 Tax=Polymorphum gilvum (strain LMG 25793 / CGMCC 1.9160 / SL003B-26A1) TaxID=991905 RepID=F2IXL2_POLGS|nr:hypothetical protein SL003B_3213 [Polymorphum gilvum SL003B-26A1]